MFGQGGSGGGTHGERLGAGTTAWGIEACLASTDATTLAATARAMGIVLLVDSMGAGGFATFCSVVAASSAS
jgi:hypothetical protein